MHDCSDKVVCLIPSAGIGKRMKPYRGVKELTTIGYRYCTVDGKIKRVPKVLGEYVIDNMLTTGAQNVIMVTNEQKSELIKFYGDGSQYNASIAYVCQNTDSKYYGMPIAIDQAYSWIKGFTVLLGMPDTIVEPDTSFSILLNEHIAQNADLTIGVFPTDTPGKLAPVCFDETTGKVIKIYDKPKMTKVFNTWNIIVWGPKFTELLHEYVLEYKNSYNKTKGEAILSDILNMAVDKELRVFAHFFEDGYCYDLGDTEKFVSLKIQLEHNEEKTVSELLNVHLINN
ncbi:sugar phosphate nucleotidyltransferase [Clostridium boliviensis]|uniref:Glucose-1-phosphate thymidylyltransferase n=1 Tax=Clostridium boliviensis TaxID=318465 RepID=A0ABU4GQM3_9CLOT|nr:sugar phosphate nucleotidyltransferase [Clostridium boliviensis]MDW2799929.1 sugar phosphate nucleotidyltransferase [Clostridium boliviensis]